jgi:hypothetical protein
VGRRKLPAGTEGIHPDRYVDWFFPKSKELLRVLKTDGTFLYSRSIGRSPKLACVFILQSIFLEQLALGTKPTAWYESMPGAFVDSLHVSTAFWVRAFWVFDVWYERYIQLSRK